MDAWQIDRSEGIRCKTWKHLDWTERLRPGLKKNQPMDRFKELQTWHMVDDELPYKKTHCCYFEDVTALEEPFLYFIKVIKSGLITAKFSRTDCFTEPR